MSDGIFKKAHAELGVNICNAGWKVGAVLEDCKHICRLTRMYAFTRIK